MDWTEKGLEFSNSQGNLNQQLLEIIQSLQVESEEEFLVKQRRIKDLFLERKFNEIFTSKELLRVYAVAYLPTRTLCYRDIFLKLDSLRDFSQEGGEALIIGGGNCAELLALLSMNCPVPITTRIIDISDYEIIPELVSAATEKLYFSNNLSIDLQLVDLLESSGLDEKLSIVSSANVIMACFVLNEIMTNSKAGFAKLMTTLIPKIKKGSYFLVVDSAGSFSEFTLGNDNTSVMLFKLLDAIKAFKIVEKYDSVWYRVPGDLKYPRKLHNMRFFLRLYQKI